MAASALRYNRRRRGIVPGAALVRRHWRQYARSIVARMSEATCGITYGEVDPGYRYRSSGLQATAIANLRGLSMGTAMSKLLTTSASLLVLALLPATAGAAERPDWA